MENLFTLEAVAPSLRPVLQVSDLVKLLRSVAEPSFNPETIAALLAGVRIDDASLTPYVHWQPKSYTRNLIHRDSVFELLTVCWDSGSCSPIHNHAGQDCWLHVHQGSLSINTYDLVNPHDVGRVGKKIVLRKLGRDQVDELALDHRGPANDIHRVVNRRSFGRRAVSLHIYARPFDDCIIYDTQNHVASPKSLCYFSIDGQPL